MLKLELIQLQQCCREAETKEDVRNFLRKNKWVENTEKDEFYKDNITYDVIQATVYENLGFVGTSYEIEYAEFY